jgi:colanic acid biosynthesis glycosyl transferase WcaI
VKIHVWGINYSPENIGIAQYNTALCEWLAEHGHAVRMITSFCYYPAWRKLPAEERLLFRTDLMDGVTVHRCWHYVPRRVTTLRRVLHELSFVSTSFLRMLSLPRPDLIVVISPPLLLGTAAWILSLIKRTKFLFHVQDLQPAAAAALGMIKDRSLLLRALRRLESLAYSKARRVSAITPGMLRHIAATGIPSEKMFLFPNGVEVPDFWRLPEKNLFRQAHGFSPDDFLVVYSGNFGRKQGLHQILEAADLVRERRIRFILCGDGAEREQLVQQAANLHNITFLPLLPEPRYRELLVDADLCLIPQQPGSGSSFFPSKLLKTLAFSAPVLTITENNSELHRALSEGGIGRNIPPGSPAQIAAALDDLSTKPELLREWGRAGFKFVKRFEQSRVLADFGQKLGLATSRT